MTSLGAPRRLSMPLILAFLMGFALVLVPSAPASAVSNGFISGKVTAPGGAPLSGIEVDFYSEIYPDVWIPVSATQTGPLGTYTTSLAPKTWRVGFSDPNGDYVEEYFDDVTDVNSASDVVVASAQVTPNIDAELAVAGHITGHIEDAHGAPIQDAEVDVYAFDGTQWDYAPAWAFTDSNGDYDVSTATGTYRLEFWADGYFGEFYDDVQTVEDGTSITVAAGDTASGNDAVLEKTAVISGTVTLPSAAGIDDADRLVTVVDNATNDVVDLAWLDPDTETAPGSHTYPWSVGYLRAGSYRVEFAHVDGQSTSEAEFYNDHPESDGAGTADLITLTTGEERSGIDATLGAGGTISGTVVDGNNQPLAGCTVFAANPADGLVTRLGTTATDGTFVVPGLTTGDYGIGVGLAGEPAPCDSSEYYTNTNGDLSATPTTPVPVSAVPGSDTAIAATLVYKGTVATPSVTNVTAPSVPTEAVVGTPLTANPGTWNPADVTLSYQWRINGGVIPGATSQSYTPPSGATGSRLSVTVTASKAGYTSASTTSNLTAPVVGPSQAPFVQNYALPAVIGVQRVGRQVSAYQGAWTDGATTSVQWMRNGVPIAGATGPTYLLAPADLGAYIQVRVTATKDGARSSQFSPATNPVQAGLFTLTSPPRLLGKLKVGKVLRAVPPSSTPAATTVRYRWFRNGVAIKGAAAKQAFYRLVSADRGKHIGVRIKLVRSAYETGVLAVKRRGTVS